MKRTIAGLGIVLAASACWDASAMRSRNRHFNARRDASAMRSRDRHFNARRDQGVASMCLSPSQLLEFVEAERLVRDAEGRIAEKPTPRSETAGI
jgi:hypothetical protein